MNERTGILGGAFNPPHNGHLALARGAVRRFGIERLIVLVSERPGHKDVDLDAATRLRLARLAFQDIPGAEVVLDEHAYTADAVADGRYRDAWFVIGADELAAFHSWKNPERVLDEVRLAVGTRPGFPRDRLERMLAELRRDRIVLFELDEPVDISSTTVRERAARREPIDDLVPPAVAKIVRELGLYRAKTGLH
jgi:nicotinate-nucleotide adenylyltransferase